MTLHQVVQLFLYIASAYFLPALASFAVGSSLAKENVDWKKFKVQWQISMAAGLVGGPVFYYWLLEGKLASMLETAGVSALVCLVAHALGAKRQNPKYQPDGRDPLRIAVEFVIIALVSALAGLAWGLLPGGNQSSGLFTVLLMGFVVYIFFLYDDTPKGNWKDDRSLLGVTFCIEAVTIVVALILWAIGAAITHVVTTFLNLSGTREFLWQEGLPLWIFLVLWILVNWGFWWLVQEPKEKPYPSFVY